MIRVEVTADDIAEGGAMSCRNCPIARALHRLGYACAEVYGRYVDPNVMDVNASIAYLPDEARRFIADFDSGARVEPFSFEIDLPAPVPPPAPAPEVTP